MSTDKYELRGVSSTKKDVHNAIKNLDKGLYPKAFCKILPDYIAHSEDHCVIMHADTAGTKSSLAYLYWKETGDLSVWKGIVQDAMVMNLDDMACSGCIDNIVISATLGRNKNLISGEVVSTIINYAEEFVENLKKDGVSLYLAGGETADVGDIVRTADVGYTAFGRMKRDDVIVVDPQPGDLIVSLASYGKASYESEYNSGMGCNGLTSARHDIFNESYRTLYPETFDPLMPEEICYAGSRKVDEEVIIGDLNTNYGKLVLSPTRTYLPVLKKILDKIDQSKLHGIIHNTGGGQFKINHFIKEDIKVIKDDLLPIPPLFQIIHEETNTPFEEMFKVFNMGMRLEFYVPSSTVANEIIQISNEFDIEAKVIGRVERSTQRGVELTYKEETYFVEADK